MFYRIHKEVDEVIFHELTNIGFDAKDYLSSLFNEMYHSAIERKFKEDFKEYYPIHPIKPYCDSLRKLFVYDLELFIVNGEEARRAHSNLRKLLQKLENTEQTELADMVKDIIKDLK